LPFLLFLLSVSSFIDPSIGRIRESRDGSIALRNKRAASGAFREKFNGQAPADDDSAQERNERALFGSGCLDRPMKIGITDILDYHVFHKCRGAVKQWYFDKEKKKCYKFTFGGCGAGSNAFNSEKECNLDCKHKCELDKDTTKCTKVEEKVWYYDLSKKKCFEFTAFGCNEKANKFKTEKACLKDCKAFIEE